MTDTAIIQNIIRSLGQSQHDRLSPALNPDFIKMDERGMAEYLEALKQLAIEIPFFDTSSGVGSPEQNWSTFFPFADAQAESWLASLGDDTPPHMGLLLAFIFLANMVGAIILLPALVRWLVYPQYKRARADELMTVELEALAKK